MVGCVLNTHTVQVCTPANLPAFDKMCTKCQTNGHFADLCRGGPLSQHNSKSQTREKPKVSEVKTKDSEKDKDADDAQIGTLSGSWMLINGIQDQPFGDHSYEVLDVFMSELRLGSSDPLSTASLSTLNSQKQPRKIRHHILNNFGRWIPSNVQPHGKLELTVKPGPSAQQQLNLPELDNNVVTSVWTLADTGAQMCVADWEVAKNLNLNKTDLLMPALSVSVADNSSLELVGAHFLTISTEEGQTSGQLVYFANNIGEFYVLVKISPH